MNVNKNRVTYIFFISTLFISIASFSKAQDMNDEFKKKLRQSLLSPEMQQSHQMYQPGQRNFQQSPDILTVSPTTRLPTRLDRFINIDKLKNKEININPLVTNAETYKTIPANSGGHDFDPVRAIQSYKARKRKEKVDKIVKAYALD